MRSSFTACFQLLFAEIGGKKRVRGEKIDEERTLEEKMGIFRTKKQRMEYLRNISSSKTNCSVRYDEVQFLFSTDGL